MLLHGWGRYPQVCGTLHRATDIDHFRDVIRSAKAPLIAHAMGRSYGDSALNTAAVSTLTLNKFIAFDERTGILHCQSGVILADIIEALLPRGWFLAVVPGTKYITVGGAIASDIHGKNHHHMGCFSETVQALTLLLPNGDLIECNRQQNSTLFFATCGGMGLTGIIVDAKIKLIPIKSTVIRQRIIPAQNLQQLCELFLMHQSAQYSVAWLDSFAKKPALGQGFLLLGEHETEVKSFTYLNRTSISVPMYLPSIINRFSLRLYNQMYKFRMACIAQESTVTINDFFFPLDRVQKYNYLYGRKGFVQYQLILPMESAYAGLEKILQLVTCYSAGCCLAVLKLLGESNRNLLSFPLYGFTLALDFKVRPQLFQLLNTLDQIVLAHGGRVYLTKDARMLDKMFKQSYPHVAEFNALRCDIGANKIFQSLQSLRLGL
ncbi:MAG: FAD-binding oxidoreductase [Gammaproteobacteria bacterium]